jgi:hypothetical protein
MQVPKIRIDEVACEELIVALLEDFVSNFEEASGDRVFQQLMISAPPVSTGSVLADGLIAATAEHLATVYRLRVPTWVLDEWRTGAVRFPAAEKPPSDANANSAFDSRNIANSWVQRLCSNASVPRLRRTA